MIVNADTKKNLIDMRNINASNMTANSLNENNVISVVTDGKSSNYVMRLRHEANGVSHARLNGAMETKKVDWSVRPEVSEVKAKMRCQSVTVSQLIFDKANLCTFSGTILATLALANVWKGRYVTIVLYCFHFKKYLLLNIG